MSTTTTTTTSTRYVLFGGYGLDGMGSGTPGDESSHYARGKKGRGVVVRVWGWWLVQYVE